MSFGPAGAVGEPRLAARVHAQHGVFTRTQAIAAGFSKAQIDRRLRAGTWARVLPRVYREAAAAPSVVAPFWAAVLWAGPGCALSHRSAAALWRLEPVVPGPLEVVVPVRRAPKVAGVVVHRGALDRADVCSVERLPVTSPARTIIDLAVVAADDELGVLIESARRRGLVTLAALLACLDALGSGGRAGAARVRRVVAALDRDRPTPAALEAHVGGLLRAAGVRVPVRGPRLFVWPGAMVRLECDGRSDAERRGTRHADRVRRDALRSAGWRLLVVTWDDVRRPEELLAHIARALCVFVPVPGA